MTDLEKEFLLDCLYNIAGAIEQSPDIAHILKEDVYGSINVLKKEFEEVK